jgi:transcriptional regulatory protein LevR
LIAIVGTVSPFTEDIPYIPIWELYQPHGFKRLLQLLEPNDATYPHDTELSFTQILDWLEQGLAQSVTHFNPKRFVQTLNQFAHRFRAQFQWDAEREIGLWMHLGIYTDQILRQKLDEKANPKIKAFSCNDQLPSEAILLWKELLEQLQSTFLMTYPPQAAHEMARLSVS